MEANLNEGLRWLVGGGGAVLAVMLISWLAERSASFQALTSDAKRVVMVCVALAFSLGAWAILTYVPPEVLATLEAPYKVAALAITTLLAQQAWHGFQKKFLAPQDGQRPQNL